MATLETIKDYTKNVLPEDCLTRRVFKAGYVFSVFIFSPFVKLKHYIVRDLMKSSIFYREDEMFMCPIFPKKIIGNVIDLYRPTSVLDLGAGTGKSLDYFFANGIKVTGVEGSALAIKKAMHPELILQYDLNNELNLHKKFDLLWSFEFVEHIHPDYLDNLMNTFSNHSNTVVLSAARPGQGGEGHFNEQEDEYWINQFKKYNYRLNDSKTKKLRALNEAHSKNMYVFERAIA